MPRARKLILLALLLAARSAAADATLSPDEDLARREYAAGAAAYARGAYEEALARFRTARTAIAVPELDYNIARTLDRLGRWQEAIDGYERFLIARPEGDAAGEVRARLTTLRQRTDVSQRRRLRIAGGVLAGSTVALAVAGSVLYGVTYGDYKSAIDSMCPTGQCPPSAVADLRSDLRGREIGSGVLWGLAGAALVADVAVWVLEARVRKRTR